MKKVFGLLGLVCFLPVIAVALVVPGRPINFVNDYAGVLSAEQIAELNTKISAFEKQTSDEIAIMIIKSLEGDTIENVAQEIFTKWGIGKKDKNNGALFLIAINDRRTRIHTGYGLEGDLTDIETSYIQSEIVAPAFRNGDYYSGINGAVDKMIEALSGSQIVPEDYSVSKKSSINFEWLFILGFIILQWFGAILGRSKSWWAGGVIGGAIGVILWLFNIFALSIVVYAVVFAFLVGFGLLFDFLVSRAYQKHKSGGSLPPWFLGGGGHSGGGFGGFGGGFSGGGGSSGKW
jgi:uncharacterized protein